MAGELDAHFGQCGMVTLPVVPVPVAEQVNAVVIQPDGKVLAAGSAVPSREPWGAIVPPGEHSDPRGTQNFRLVRLNPDGAPDVDFDGVPGGIGTSLPVPGRATIDFQGRSDSAADLAVDADGKIVVAGTATVVKGPGDAPRSFFAVARLEPKRGRPDGTFKGVEPELPGFGGKATIDFGNAGGAAATCVATQRDGRVVVGGSTRAVVGMDPPWSICALARLTRFGKPDATFGTKGRATLKLSEFGDGISDVAVQPDGKIVAGGVTGTEDRNGGGIYTLLRFNPDGSLDKTFGEDGIVSEPSLATLTRFAVQPDGKIVGGDFRFSVVRHNPDGSVDKSFGTNGVTKADFGGGDGAASSLALQPNGRVVVAGSIGSHADSVFALARFNPDGTPDTTFGTGGTERTRLDGPAEATDVVIQADGKISAVGRVIQQLDAPVGAAHFRFAFVRYLGDR